MFSLSNTKDDFEKDIENCSNFYLLSFSILFLFSFLINLVLGGVLIFNNYKHKCIKNSKKTSNVGVSVEIGETKITEIELTTQNPIYKRQNLPDWVVKEYLESKK